MTQPGVPRPAVGVGTMILREGRVLMGKRRGAHGEATWGWCGGHLEVGESLEDCAVREVHEESGLRVEPDDLHPLCVHNVIAYGRHYLDVEFWTERAVGEPAVREASRIVAWDWFALDALPEPLFEPARLALVSWADRLWYHRQAP